MEILTFVFVVILISFITYMTNIVTKEINRLEQSIKENIIFYANDIYKKLDKIEKKLEEYNDNTEKNKVEQRGYYD